MLAMPEFEPIGIVRSEESKAALVETGVPAECVAVCDVMDAAAVEKVAAGCEAFLICTSAKPAPTGATNPDTGRPVFGFPKGEPEEVDWIGQKNQVGAALKQGPATRVVICSSMGGTDADHMLNRLGRTELPDGTTQGGNSEPPRAGCPNSGALIRFLRVLARQIPESRVPLRAGCPNSHQGTRCAVAPVAVLLWKRKAEQYAIDSGLPYTIVHPGGLLNEAGGKRELCVGVDDTVEGTDSYSVPREDVAAVMVEALLHDEYRGRSFDLVSKPEGEGEVTRDFRALIVDGLGERNADYSLGTIAS